MKKKYEDALNLIHRPHSITRPSRQAGVIRSTGRADLPTPLKEIGDIASTGHFLETDTDEFNEFLAD